MVSTMSCYFLNSFHWQYNKVARAVERVAIERINFLRYSPFAIPSYNLMVLSAFGSWIIRHIVCCCKSVSACKLGMPCSKKVVTLVENSWLSWKIMQDERLSCKTLEENLARRFISSSIFFQVLQNNHSFSAREYFGLSKYINQRVQLRGE